jgi:hypothetical protein
MSSGSATTSSSTSGPTNTLPSAPNGPTPMDISNSSTSSENYAIQAAGHSSTNLVPGHNTAPGPVASPSEIEERIIQGINIVHALSSFDSSIVSGPILKYLQEVWDSPGRASRLGRKELLTVSYIDESRLLVECFLVYLRNHREDVSILWQLLTVFKLRTLVDYTFLSDFITDEICQKWSVAERNHLVKQFLTQMESISVTQSSRARSIRYVLRPVLKNAFLTRPQRTPEEYRALQLAELPKQKKDTSESSPTNDDSKVVSKSTESTDEAKNSASEMDVDSSQKPSVERSSSPVDKASSNLLNNPSPSSESLSTDESGTSSQESTGERVQYPAVWFPDEVMDNFISDSIVLKLLVEPIIDEVRKKLNFHLHHITVRFL